MVWAKTKWNKASNPERSREADLELKSQKISRWKNLPGVGANEQNDHGF